MVESPFVSHPRPQKPRASKARWLAVPAVLLVGGASLYGCMVGFDVAPHPGDRDLVVTIDEVTVGLPFTKDPSRESLKRTWYLDGSVDVVYEYDDSEGKMPVYLNSQVTRASSSADADGQYMGMKLGAQAMFAVSGADVTEVPRDDLLKWGDKSTCTLLTMAGSTVGNVFVAKRGDRVVMLMLSGVFFDDKEALGNVLLPKLAKVGGARL